MKSDGYGSDADLVEGLRRREEAAATAFVHTYLPLIRAVLRKFMYPDREGSEPRDLADESIELAEKLIRAVSGTRPVTNLRSFVATSAANAGRDWHRRYQKEMLLESNLDSTEIGVGHLDVDSRTDDEVSSAAYVPINPAAASVLEQARGVLKKWELDLLDLRARGFSYEEIAILLRDDVAQTTEASRRQRKRRAYEKVIAECRRLATGNPRVESALEEGQRMIRERTKVNSSKEDS